jgi:hypothetical protein
MRLWLARHWMELKIFMTVWIVYAVFVMPAGGTLPNRYLDSIHSIVNEQRLEIDTYHENTDDKAFYNGHYYNGALPGPALMGVPAYIVFKGLYSLVPQTVKELAGGIQSFKQSDLADSSFYGQVDDVEFFLSHMFLTLTVIASISALGAVFLFKSICRLGYRPNVAVVLALLYAFSTNLFFYATGYFHHNLSATLGVAAFYLLIAARSESDEQSLRRAAIGAGILSGSAFLIEYATILTGVWLGVWLFLKISKRSIGYYVLGFVPPLLILALYNWLAFDDPFTTSYRYLAVNNRFHTSGVFGLTYPRMESLVGLVVGDKSGLFVFAPLAAIGMLGIAYQILKRKNEQTVALVCGAIVASYLAFYASYSVWDGGSVFGPRFLIPVLPFVFLGVAFATEFVPKWVIGAVGAIGILFNWLGAQYGYTESLWNHFTTLFSQGPTLPVFGAILSHSTSRASPLYIFADSFHGILTLGVSLLLVLFIVWWWRELWLPKRVQ